MVMTSNQLKKSIGVSNGLKRKQQPSYTPKANGEKRTIQEIKQGLNDGVYNFTPIQRDLEKTINFGTFERDLEDMFSIINETSSKWQNPETMKANREKIEGMQTRINAYKEYMSVFGKPKPTFVERKEKRETEKYRKAMDEIDSLQKQTKDVLDNWDALSEEYNKHSDEEEYNHYVSLTEEKRAMASVDMDAVQKEVSDLETILKTAKGYQRDYDGFKNREANVKLRSKGFGENPWTDDKENAKKTMDDYLVSVGYKDIAEIEKALGEKKKYRNETWWVQKGIKMADVADPMSENYDEEFEKYSTYKPKKKGWFDGTTQSREVYEYINTQDSTAKSRLKNIYSVDTSDLDNMTAKEKATFNYYYNKYGKGMANEYLNTISERLANKTASKRFEGLEGETGWEMLFGVEAGLDQFMTGVRNLGKTDESYIPVNSTQQLSGMVRDDLDDRLGGWGTVPYDFINTTANMAPSIATSAAVGAINPIAGTVTGAGLMGASAGGNAYQEMVNQGYDPSQARTYAAIVGVSEAGLQYALGGIGSLGGTSGKIAKMVDGIDNAAAKFAIQYGGSVASEGLEEGLQEVLSPVFKNLAAGYDTGEDVDWENVFYSALLGGMSGGFFGGAEIGAQTYSNYTQNKAIGQNIKANERVGDMFDMAATPEMKSAYEAYNKYAKKGITKENVSDSRLGNLYSKAMADAQAVIDSDTSTQEQIDAAQQTIDQLKVFSQSNTESRTGSAHNLDDSVYDAYDTESVVSLIEEGLESGADTEAHKIATEYKEKVENFDELSKIVSKKMNGEELSADEAQMLSESKAKLSQKEIATLMDANDKAIRVEERDDIKAKLIEKGESEEIADIAARKMRGETLTTEESAKLLESEEALSSIAEVSNAENVTEGLIETAKTMDKEKGALFISLYDGTTDVESYTNAFNLAVMKTENNFGIQDVIKTKNVLSNAQVGKIYSEIAIKSDQAQRANFLKLSEKTAKLKAYKGVIDDSVIDYNNTSQKGKVNWNSLDSRQRKAITFVKGFAQATGLNLTLVKDGKERGMNGAFEVEGNEIILDIYAGIDVDNNALADTIIPTMSHELTHWMEKKSPVLYRKLCNIVFDTLQKKDGLSEWVRIDRERRRLIEKGLLKETDSESKQIERARSEIVARACEDMLSRSKVGREMFNSLSNTEKKTLIEKIQDIIQDIKDWIKDTLGLYKSNAPEAKILRDYQEELDKLSKVWDAMLTESVEVNRALEKSGAFEHKKNMESEVLNQERESQREEAKKLAKVGLQIDEETNSIAPITLLSERTWTKSEYVQNREVAINAIVKALGVSKKEAERYVKNINSIARMIANDRERLDYEQNVDENSSVIKSNKEYKWTVDMSTLCAKRLLFTGTFDEIQKRLPNTAFNSEDMVSLRSMMMERGYEVACGICYVESTRRELGTITAEFIERYKLSQETGKPITRINSKGKIKELTKSQEMMEISADKSTNKFIADKNYTPTLADLNTTDIDIVKTEHPLVYEAYVTFMKARGQATPKLLETRTEYKGEILKHFKTKTAVDSRNSAGGLRVQSFSDFEIAHLIDMMQIVLDMSRVGLMSQAYTKVPEFADVFGNTGIKINLSLIAKDSGLDANGNLIFDDVEGMPHERAFALRKKYSKNVGTILVGKNDAHIRAALADSRIDYVIPFHKSFWSESLYDALGLTGYSDYTDTQNEKPFDENRKIKNFQPSEYWDYSKSGEENAKTYLKMCEEDGRIPKFPQFQNCKGYWKLLIDFKMYDNNGVGAPQMVVKPEFSMKEAKDIMNAYKGGHREFPVAKDVVDDFVEKYEGKKDMLLSERDTEGNTLSKGQIEYFKDSKVRDENGSLQVMYRGDSNEFTVFDRKKTSYANLYGRGFYFTKSKSHAEQYGNAREFYLDIKNPLLPKQNVITKEQMLNFLTAIENDGEDYDLYNYGQDATAESVLNSVWGKGDFEMLQDISAGAIGDLVAAVELFNEVNGTSYDGIILPTETVTFNSEQAKLTSNLNPTKDKDILFSERDVIDIPFDMYPKMEEHFGTTKNFDVAGYMLRDGTMLDFSGKHWGDTSSKFRQVDHRDIQEVLEDENNGIQSMMSMISNGNIRLMPETGGINLANEPNGLQLSVLRDYINHFKGEVIVDIDAIGGDTIHSFEYSKGTSASKILSDLEGYFKRGEIPAHTKSSVAEFLYSERVMDEKTLKFLNNQRTLKVYRAMQVIDGKLYPPMAAKIKGEDGKKELVYSSEIGVWEQATEHPELIKEGKFELDKANGSSIKAAYNPYIHTSASPLNDQFSSAYKRDNLVTVEGEIPISELTSGYRAEYAKDSVGETKWHSGPVASKLKGDKARKVYLSRWFKPTRIVPDYEVASIVAKTLEGENISVPYKVVTPSLREKLEKEGVSILYSERDSDSVYDMMGEAERLKKENEKLKADVERLNERLKLEGKVTDGKYLNNDHLLKAAGHLRNIAKSDIDKVQLAKSLKEFYTFISQSENLAWEDVFRQSYSIAESILEEAKPEVMVDDYSKMILKEIRTKKISFSEQQKAEAKYRFGKNWNRSFIGNVTIKNDAIPLESQWQEWANMYPDIFDADISETDMVEALYDVIGTLKDSSEIIMEYDKTEQIRWLASEVYNQFWNVSNVITTADKFDKKIKRLNFEHRNAMAELRENYRARMEEKAKNQKLVDDMYYGRILLEKDKKIAKQKLADDIHYGKLINKLKIRKEQEVDLARKRGYERLNKYKENAERKTLIQSTMATAMALNKKLTTNSKDVHIPQELKPVVINLLNSIDFSSKQMLGMTSKKFEDKWGTPTKRDIATEKALSKVHSMDVENPSLKRTLQAALELFEDAGKVLVEGSNSDSSMVALDVDMIEELKKLINDIDIIEEEVGYAFVLQELSNENLKTINKTIKSINHWAVVADKALANRHKKRISELGIKTVEENDVLGERQEHVETVESIKTFFSWRNLLPANAFKRLGTAAMEVFDGLRDAQDKVTFNRQDVYDFMDGLLKKHKGVKKWRKDIKTFKLNLPDGEKKEIKMPVSFIMSLYCVSKQEDAQRHLFGKDALGNDLFYTDDKGVEHTGGGMTISRFNDKGLKVSKYLDNIIVNADIVNQITNALTKEQREVADLMQGFMNTKGSEWGDAVSMALYGIKKFGVENYFPITVSPHTLNTMDTEDRSTSMFSILNYGFTKERNPHANQSIEIGDIFDVFANHMNMVAIYNAYALPIYDIARWYNFKGKTDKGMQFGVSQSIENTFGKGATSYVKNLIKDLNGQHESSRLGFITKIFKNTKVAMVGNSLSVALLQPTAYFKAMTKIPPQYLLKSLLNLKDGSVLAMRGVNKAKKYCGIALLKSQGYFETGVSANTTKKMMHDETFMEKVTEASLWGAGVMDERTWGLLWNACEFEVRAKRKDLKVGSPEFYEVIADKLRDVIYETQVVDSPLTKSDLMRSSDTGAKMVTMFASEITVAYNMVEECIYNAVLDYKRYGRKSIGRSSKNILMTLASYTATSAVVGLLNTVVQNYRYGDDEEKEFMEQVKDNFFSDWLFLGKIPYIKDAISISQGYSSSRTDLAWLDSAKKAYDAWQKIEKHEAKASEWRGKGKSKKAAQYDEYADNSRKKLINEALKSASYFSGVAGYNQWRDLRPILKSIGIID